MSGLFALKYGSVPPSRSSKRYKVIKKIGEGSYGDVHKCLDLETNNFVAVKIFRDKYLKEEDLAKGASPPQFDIRKIALREIKMLRVLRHPNLINLIEYFRYKQKLHLVFEFCDETVLDVIQRYPNGVPRQETLDIIGQLLIALGHCHLHFCVHRDIKPENLLMTSEGTVKLCDFGFARVLKPGVDLTDYVATRWYRAPELLVGDKHYGSGVDIWAVGCLFAEMVTCKPLWPGKSDLDQLYLICKNLGQLLPSQLKLFSESKFYAGLTIPDPGPIEPLEDKVPMKNIGKDGMEVLKKCLVMDPAGRLDCQKLLGLSYFKDFRKTARARSVMQTQPKESRILPILPGAMLSNSFNLNGSNKLKFH